MLNNALEDAFYLIGLNFLMTNPAVRKVDEGVVFVVKVVPGSSRTAVCGLLDGMIKIKVSAAPEKGKANKCLVEFLAKQLGVKKNAVRIISGQTNPVKQIEVSGISVDTLLEKLNKFGKPAQCMADKLTTSPDK